MIKVLERSGIQGPYLNIIKQNKTKQTNKKQHGNGTATDR
jgi:hypothetical protein